MNSIVRKVAAFARQERLFRRANNALIAVSGGPDSLAVLLVLRELSDDFGLNLTVAHFDHQLRPGSGAEMARVRELAASLGVPCLTGEGDVARAAREEGIGVEEMARRMRYQFLGFVAAEKRMDRVVTGHTADDQVETVLQRIVRGSGVRGIRGMLPLSPVPGSPSQQLARPLLVLTHDETLAVCRAAGIEPITDPSNADRRHTRNRIRHETLPGLRALNPSVNTAILGLAASARQAFVAFEEQAMLAQPASRDQGGSVFALKALAALPLEALLLVIEREAAFHKLECAANRTELRNASRVLASGSGRVAFGKVELVASCRQVRIGSLAPAGVPFEARVLNVPGVTLAGGWRIQVSTSELAADPGSFVTVIDPAVVRGVLRARPPAPGDRISYHGRTRKLFDVFADHHVPSWQRKCPLVIAGAEDVVAAVGVPGGIVPPPEGDDVLFARISPA